MRPIRTLIVGFFAPSSSQLQALRQPSTSHPNSNSFVRLVSLLIHPYHHLSITLMSATCDCPTPSIIDTLSFAIGYFIVVMLAFGLLVIAGIGGFFGLWFFWNFVKVAFNRATNGPRDADESYNVVPTEEDV
ncbi:hypothetical protein BV25DRAFT_1920376 [Artomyces pyxidatus]|uniref:Uncharacterized protein n=1 Tax=Artomyces pyxidatus TaxID=48021 RepID=A0ACB8SL24_9AGAM|nr:hypothetical protein BV25DRAFT_1920376 [Artomyces pyxidatus]